MTLEYLNSLVIEAITLAGIKHPTDENYPKFYLSKGLKEDSLGEWYLYYKISYINFDKLNLNLWSKNMYLKQINKLTKTINEGHSIYAEYSEYD